MAVYSNQLLSEVETYLRIIELRGKLSKCEQDHQTKEMMAKLTSNLTLQSENTIDDGQWKEVHLNGFYEVRWDGKHLLLRPSDQSWDHFVAAREEGEVLDRWACLL